jgi:regulator of sigma E protease
VDLLVRHDGQESSHKVIIAESPETHAGTLGIEPTYFIGNEPVVDEVSAGSPAEEGGLKAGDKILQINQVPIETWTEMTDQVGASEGQKLAVVVKRGEELINVFVVPRYDDSLKKWLLGIKKDTQKAEGGAFQKRRYGFGEAVTHGIEENWKLGKLTFSVLGRLVTLKLSYKTLGGPIRIAQASALAAKSGLSDFLYFLCFLSLQLGILNLLPLPVLDGGHLLFFSIEAIRRKPVSLKVRMVIEQAGFFLLITLMVLVTLNDVQNIWNVGKFFEKIKSLF